VWAPFFFPFNVVSIKRIIEFQVLDILTTFNFFLEWPWLHEHQAVSSTLHQKAKTPIKKDVVIIKGNNLCVTITNKAAMLEIKHDHDDEELYYFKTVVALQ